MITAFILKHDHYRTKNESHIKFISKYWKLLQCANYNITKNKKNVHKVDAIKCTDV